MKGLSKLAITMGLLSTFSAVPLLAQMENGVDFTTDFGFYAGGAKFAAGTYRVTLSDPVQNILLIESADGKHAAFADSIATEAAKPQKQSDVTFHKYGETEYLSQIAFEGRRFGLELRPTRSEEKAAANKAAEESSAASSAR
jgi:hypothetical protein